MSPSRGPVSGTGLAVRVTRGARQLGPVSPNDFADRLASQLVFAWVRLREAERFGINVWHRVSAVRRAQNRVLYAAPVVRQTALQDLEREAHARCRLWAQHARHVTPDTLTMVSPEISGRGECVITTFRAQDLRQHHMRRSWTHIRQILLAIESGDHAQCEQMQAHEYQRHLDLLLEAGLLQSQAEFPSVAMPATSAVRLAWAGHDLLAMIRDEQVWHETLRQLTPLGGDGGIDVLQSVATAAAFRILDAHARDRQRPSP